MKIDTPITPAAIKPPSTRPETNPPSDEGETQKAAGFKAPAPAAGLPAVIPRSGDKNITEVHIQPVVPDVNVRNLSPRDMAELSLNLYANGILNWEEHEMLSFQPDLNPAFNDTVGALTGEMAEPDQPRDYLDIWEKRLDFERKYNPENRDSLRNSRQIVLVLRRLASPFNISV